MSKVVIVNYSQNDAFKIPKGINLEDETVVEEWWVKWNRLHINFVDGTTKVIHSEGWIEHMDYKNPSEDAVIEDAADYGIDDSEDEEEEEEELLPWCYENDKNAICNCPQPCSPPIKDDKEEKQVETLEPAPKKVVVKRITINNVLYLLSKTDNILYDNNTHDAIGIWNSETNTIEDLPDSFYETDEE